MNHNLRKTDEQMTKVISAPIHGWLVLDKPIGLTSTQALGKVRRLLSGKKAGHGGTLDPLATGILPLAFGEATKLISYVMDGDKDYEFTICWGEQRTTDDAEGEVTVTSDHRPTETAIRQALTQFTGFIQQTPPAFSAIKLDGERAYDIARAGGVPELVARPIMIYDLKLVSMPDPNHAVFAVTSGKGMYVRSLARDLALVLGTCGYISQLRRTRVGQFNLDQAVSLEKLTALAEKGEALTAVLPLKTALNDIPCLQLTASEANRLQVGQSLLIRPHQIDMLNAPIVMAEHQGVPVAMVEAKNGAFHVVRGFCFS